MILKRSSPKVSVLLLNWNGITYTTKCLDSLLKSSYPNLEIIVVDNGSENEEGSLLERAYKNKITVIKNKKNVGYAKGMNIAYSYAHSKYVAFVNNDMEFDREWLSPLVAVLEKDSTIGACQPKLLNLSRKQYFEYASACGGYVDIFGYPFARGRIFTYLEKDKGQYNQIAKISWNGIFMTRRSVLEKIGLFNPIYFNYGEDMDLSFRMYGAGYSIANVPQSVVYHFGGGVLKKDMVKKMFFHHRNNIIILLINWPWDYLLFVLPIRIAMDIVTIFYYLSVKFTAGSIGILKAYASLFTLLPQIFTERKRAQRIIKKQYFSRMPIYKGSVAWQYFIRKKKTFREIIKDDTFTKFHQHTGYQRK